MTPFLYFAIKGIYKKNGENLGKVMWCDDKEIRPYFVAAGKALKYGNMRRQLSDSLENKPLPPICEELQALRFLSLVALKSILNTART